VADSVKCLAEIETDDNNVRMMRQQVGDSLQDVDVIAADVDPVSLKANWSLKTSDDGSISRAGYINCRSTRRSMILLSTGVMAMGR